MNKTIIALVFGIIFTILIVFGVNILIYKIEVCEEVYSYLPKNITFENKGFNIIGNTCYEL